MKYSTSDCVTNGVPQGLSSSIFLPAEMELFLSQSGSDCGVTNSGTSGTEIGVALLEVKRNWWRT
jgi:hypothetical protein